MAPGVLRWLARNRMELCFVAAAKWWTRGTRWRPTTTSAVLVVGDVVGHGLAAARRAAFARTRFAATPLTDDFRLVAARFN